MATDIRSVVHAAAINTPGRYMAGISRDGVEVDKMPHQIDAWKVDSNTGDLLPIISLSGRDAKSMISSIAAFEPDAVTMTTSIYSQEKSDGGVFPEQKAHRITVIAERNGDLRVALLQPAESRDQAPKFENADPRIVPEQMMGALRLAFRPTKLTPAQALLNVKDGSISWFIYGSMEEMRERIKFVLSNGWMGIEMNQEICAANISDELPPEEIDSYVAMLSVLTTFPRYKQIADQRSAIPSM